MVVGLVFVFLLVKVIIPESKYNEAIGLYNDGEYEEATDAFEALNNYKDNKEQILNYKTAIYNKAVSLINAGEYNEAITAFDALDGYKDSAEQIAKYKNKILKSANVGDYVVFGSYQQDSKTSNGKEDIAWLVLAKEDNKVLVISRYALDCQPYNTSYTDVTWENCSLRKSLNDTFGCAECVTDDGYAEGLGGSNVDNIRVGVRPAMWIDLGAL